MCIHRSHQYVCVLVCMLVCDKCSESEGQVLLTFYAEAMLVSELPTQCDDPSHFSICWGSIMNDTASVQT